MQLHGLKAADHRSQCKLAISGKSGHCKGNSSHLQLPEMENGFFSLNVPSSKTEADSK